MTASLCADCGLPESLMFAHGDAGHEFVPAWSDDEAHVVGGGEQAPESGYTCPTACVQRNHPGREHERWIAEQRQWLCDVHDEPATCLTSQVPVDATCRPCRARAADRVLDALRTRTPSGRQS